MTNKLRQNTHRVKSVEIFEDTIKLLFYKATKRYTQCVDKNMFIKLIGLFVLHNITALPFKKRHFYLCLGHNIKMKEDLGHYLCSYY